MYGQDLQARLTEHDKLPEGAEERKIFVDTQHPLDSTFKEYGHIFYNVLIKNARDKWTTESGIKYWEQNGEYRKFLSKNVPVYPFEPMEHDIEEVISGELKSSKFKFLTREGEKMQQSHNGFTAYWMLLSENMQKVVRGSHEVDDVVQIGLVLRNGIGTGVALGADFLTYRLTCLNGAIGRGENFGSISIRHIGDQKKMIDTFKNGIPIIVKMGEKIVDYYEKATQIKIDERIARLIYKKTGIADKYYEKIPYIEIDKEQKKVEERVSLTRDGRHVTLWELFNDLTKPLTDSFNQADTRTYRSKEKRVIHLGMSSFSSATRALHTSLRNIVDNRTNKAEVA
jgi:hypothetical protein